MYGLGANALDARAVARIFEAKGRPSTSPLIVHVASIEMARELAAEWPAAAEALARRYWPGPLTLVVRKQPAVPDIVTAGLGTVGLRVPSHPIALELIRQSGVPIAAPSANRFSQISPTTAGHVREGLGAAVDLILDGGPTQVGIESTVLSLVGTPVLLRSGMISQREIEEWIGPVEVAADAGEGSHPSPGMHRRHYSPRTPLVLVRCGRVPERGRGAYLGFADQAAAPAEAVKQFGDTPGSPCGTSTLQCPQACPPELFDSSAVRVVRMPLDAAKYAAMLYETLHMLDREGLDWIAAELPPEGAEWAGIADRLKRAAVK